MYDEEYELYKHSESSDLDSVFFQHPEEDVVTGSRYEKLVLELLSLKVPEVTNESLSDLLEYPRYLLEKIIKEVKKVRAKEANALSNLSLNKKS